MTEQQPTPVLWAARDHKGNILSTWMFQEQAATTADAVGGDVVPLVIQDPAAVVVSRDVAEAAFLALEEMTDVMDLERDDELNVRAENALEHLDSILGITARRARADR